MDESVICVAFPTIMSGLVLRWYPTAHAYADNCQIANAGREEAWVHDSCPTEVVEAAHEAHELIRAAYRRSLHPDIDVSRWVTHRSAGFLSRDLVPVAGVR